MSQFALFTLGVCYSLFWNSRDNSLLMSNLQLVLDVKASLRLSEREADPKQGTASGDRRIGGTIRDFAKIALGWRMPSAHIKRFRKSSGCSKRCQNLVRQPRTSLRSLGVFRRFAGRPTLFPAFGSVSPGPVSVIITSCHYNHQHDHLDRAA